MSALAEKCHAFAGELYRMQGEGCYLCKQPKPLEELEADHCHAKDSSGAIRGLACRQCNTLRGHLGDKTGDNERILQLLEHVRKLPWLTNRGRNIHNSAGFRPRKTVASYVGKQRKTIETALINLDGYRCMCCGSTEPGLCLDHCHATGFLRSLLCRGCNFALGLCGESEEKLKAIAQAIALERSAFGAEHMAAIAALHASIWGENSCGNTYKDYEKAYQKAWYEANKDKKKAYLKAYREANKDKNKAYFKAYREANKDKRKAYREANKDKLNAQRRARRVYKRQALTGLPDNGSEQVANGFDLGTGSTG